MVIILLGLSVKSSHNEKFAVVGQIFTFPQQKIISFESETSSVSFLPFEVIAANICTQKQKKKERRNGVGKFFSLKSLLSSNKSTFLVANDPKIEWIECMPFPGIVKTVFFSKTPKLNSIESVDKMPLPYLYNRYVDFVRKFGQNLPFSEMKHWMRHVMWQVSTNQSALD